MARRWGRVYGIPQSEFRLRSSSSNQMWVTVQPLKAGAPELNGALRCVSTSPVAHDVSGSPFHIEVNGHPFPMRVAIGATAHVFLL